MSPQIRIIRGLAAIVVIITSLRIYSYARERKRRGVRDFFSFISVALISPHLVYTAHRFDARPRQPLRQIVRIVVGIGLIWLALVVSRSLVLSDASSNSWWVNHLIVVGAFVVIMQSFGQVLYGKWRLRGFRVTPLVDNILLSRTPADFWRRWSWPMHLWLYRYVYKPAGGKRHFVRAVLAVFLVSGLLHELLVYSAIGRVTGHQTMYFMISGLGVLASPALDRLGQFGLIGQILMRAITLTFLAVSAALMFVTIHYIFPIYMKHIWLMW
jgi:hypothetical protein